MKKKLMRMILTTLLLCSLFSMTAFASTGTLTQDETSIHFLKADGTYATETWVEVAGLWYFFDINGNLASEGKAAPDEYDHYRIYTSYIPYSTSSLETLAANILDGDVIEYEGQYYCTPEFATRTANENVVYSHDISTDTEYAEDTGYTEYTGYTEDSVLARLWDIDIDIPDTKKDTSYDLDGVN